MGCKDESEATYLISRAESLLKSDPDSTLILLDSIIVPDNLNDKLLARWCMLYGKVADTLYTDLPYVQQLLRARAYYESHGTLQEQAKIGLYLGRSYVEDNENEKAMKVYLQALDVALACKDYNQAGYICSYMGDLYDFDNDYLLGRNKYLEAERYFRKAGNMRSAAFALRDAGRTCVFADSVEMALEYLLRADSIIVKAGDSSDISSISNGLGNVYSLLGNMELAKQYLWKSIHISDFDDAPNYSALAGVYIEEGDFDNARLCLERAGIISTLNKETHISITYDYYKLEKAEGNMEKSLSYLERYSVASDSILAFKNKENIVEVEKKYEHLKVLLENIQLRLDKQIYFISMIIFIVACLLLLLIYQIRMNRKNKKIYHQQINLEQMSNSLLRLKECLRIKQEELQGLSSQLSKRDLENQYQQMEQEEKCIINRIAELRKELLLSSVIAKKVIKLSQKVVAGLTKSPLTEKDWQNIVVQVNDIYPSFEKKLAELGMAFSHQRYCYLTLFHLDTMGVAILLNIQPDSVNKLRQRVRRKLGIIGEDIDLYAHLLSLI